MMPDDNEKTPLLKNNPVKPSASTASEEELNLTHSTHTHEETLIMFVNMVRDAMLEKKRPLTNENIQTLTRLSLTCKSMYNLLSVTNTASPFYCLPIEFFLEKTQRLLTIKNEENNKTSDEIKYLEQHILELKELKERSLLISLRDPMRKRTLTQPPVNSSHWNHQATEETINGCLLGLCLSINCILGGLNKLPGQNKLSHVFQNIHSKDEKSASPIQIAMSEIMAFLIMFVAFSAAGILLLIPTLHLINTLLRSTWLTHSEKELASLVHYPPKALQHYQQTYNELNNNKLEITKHSALTLFNKVSALKQVPAVDKKDIEAQDIMEENEPRLRVNG